MSFDLRYIMKFHRSTDFEAMKVRKMAIWPWLSCSYNENKLMDLPSSVRNTYLPTLSCPDIVKE